MMDEGRKNGKRRQKEGIEMEKCERSERKDTRDK